MGRVLVSPYGPWSSLVDSTRHMSMSDCHIRSVHSDRSNKTEDDEKTENLALVSWTNQPLFEIYVPEGSYRFFFNELFFC